MEPNPLAKKLLLKPGSRAGLVNAPEGFRARLEPLPDGAVLLEEVEPALDFVQVFARNAAQLEASSAAFGAVKANGLLWVCYPKGGKKAGTDLNRDVLWELMGRRTLKGVTLVAIDETWSAMRFRLAGEVGA